MKNNLPGITTLFFMLLIQPAFSQATRTWVSGVGDDVNPCSRTAPCKTLAGAISKTAIGGEINVLDPGGFGAVTITKSITIDGGGVIGSIISSGINGIIINAPDASVTIRNFSINGAGATLGTNGIRVVAVKKLNVQNCIVTNFSGKGIDMSSTSTADIVLNNVTITNVSEGIGITGTTSSTGSSGFTTIDGCRIQSVQNTGINIGSGKAMISKSVVSGCGTGIAAKSGTEVHITGNTITNNSTALQGPGTLTSSGNNAIVKNNSQGATATVVNQQ